MKIGWSDLNNVQEAGQYPFSDGVITVLDLEIAIWRKHPTALFALMRKNPIRQGVDTFLGLLNFRVKTSRHDDACIVQPSCTAYRNKEKKMSENLGEFERLLGHAALRLWSELPREVQENLFETAVPLDPVIRNRLAIFLHDRHPRTAHPPKPTELA